MTAKRKTQIFITVSAILVGLIHLFFPNLKIDAIFITLIIIAIIPWLEPLLKSVELPGGLKVEFQDFKKLEEEAIKAGLIKSDGKTEIKEITTTNSDTFSFIEIAEQNEELALVGFRIEIEKRLRSLADKYSIESNRYSVTRLIEALAKEEILTIAEKTSLLDIISTLNKASHGMEYDQRSANWVIENGPKILDSLDEKLEVRGGRISLGSTDEKAHWIDKSFDNCEWTTNYEWGESIKTHSDLWEKEMNRIYQSLLVKLKEPQKKKLIKTQSNWLNQIELEKDFIYSFEDLHLKIGSGGISASAMNFMNKIRERTLELEEVLNRLTD
ncbi:lysozyme inhibitor LprI family protein [Flavobacterium sp. 83]|uniref:lysozyme inhibitor LprI family protein n=1 Tax=Flavobacterium sp. 83 TaxID=1131812 RepID=UPI000557D4B3|nr:lysozyme inhibitor LprI family protein [Flavobacterium sp. 83]